MTNAQVEHTPGPWETVETPHNMADEVRTEDGHLICEFPYGLDANALLVKAAPDLLEACQTMVEWFRRERDGFDGHRKSDADEAKWRAWFDENVRICDLAETQARAAIAKATGAQA